MKTTLQKLKKTINDKVILAERYYSILSVINNFKLTQREIQLLAFTAVKGNMTYANVREEFCKTHNTTSPTINNIISKLKKMSLLIKDQGKIKVNPKILLDFEDNLVLEISFTHE
jgi:hypothetical protein